jgi:alpha-N-arabinofuranosidase
LVDWEQIGYVLTRETQLPLSQCRASGGIFAPTIRHHDGRFYMITTNTRRTPGKPAGNFYVTTDDIRGEWSEPIWVDAPGIDPDLFFDDDGKVYFTSNDCQSQIDISTGKLIGPAMDRWPGYPHTQAPEAPHLYKLNGMYYTMLAEGGTELGHMVTIARSRNVTGPWELCPHNPILSHRSLNTTLNATGHADIVQGPDGRWWIVFLAIRTLCYPKYHLLGRETCLAPVEWSADGWPVVNGGQPVELKMDVPELSGQQPAWSRWEDDFCSDAFKMEWNFLRNPDMSLYSLADVPGALCLRCGPNDLDSLESPAWIGRRLQHFDTEQSVELSFNPQGEDEEAGLSLFLQQRTHYDVFLTQRDQQRVAIARRSVGSIVVESAPMAVPDGPVTFSIITGETEMDLGIMTHSGRVSLVRGESKFISSEFGGRFTGLFVALFAQGPADGGGLSSLAQFRTYAYQCL